MMMKMMTRREERATVTAMMGVSSENEHTHTLTHQQLVFTDPSSHPLTYSEHSHWINTHKHTHTHTLIG